MSRPAKGVLLFRVAPAFTGTLLALGGDPSFTRQVAGDQRQFLRSHHRSGHDAYGQLRHRHQRSGFRHRAGARGNRRDPFQPGRIGAQARGRPRAHHQALPRPGKQLARRKVACLRLSSVLSLKSTAELSCHPERTGPQTSFSLGVVSRRICGCT